MNKNIIDKEINLIINKLINHRRYIHMYPELGYQEVNTSSYIATTLEEIGIEVNRNIGGNGVVGIIRGGKPGKTVLLRADMDALPIVEETNLEFSSKNHGKMHACGHDIHITIMLGVAEILYKYKDKIEGNIKFMFQPAEECSPNGGSKGMIADGVMENPTVDYALAVHMMPELEIGHIGITEGAVTAQSDSFSIKIIGKAGHASTPHKGVDAVLAAANVVMNMQGILTKMIDPHDQALVSIGKIHGGEAYNIICEMVTLDGTVRMMTPGCVEDMPKLIRQVANNSCAVYGAKCQVRYTKGYSILYNAKELVDIVTQVCIDNFGEESVVHYPQCAGGEDFAFIAKCVPSMFIWLGSRTHNTEYIPQHSGKVIFDEESIPIGITTIISTVSRLLTIDDISYQ